jgi:hypothetical protein
VQRSILATGAIKMQTPIKRAKTHVDSAIVCVNDEQYCCDAA